MADLGRLIADSQPTTRQLRYAGAALAYLVAGVHLFHPKRGFPRLVLLVSTDNVSLLLSDPRPLLFVLSGFAIIAGVVLARRDSLRKPIYLLGMALMLTYVFGYFAWHLSGHGGILPGRVPHYHGLSPVAAVIDHLQVYAVARFAIFTELLLLVVLAVLYRQEF